MAATGATSEVRATGTAREADAPRRLAVAVACLFALLLVYLSASPHQSDDFWFHLKMGEFYAASGPSLPADPLLHTARPGPPVAHEWLFAVTLHELASRVGLGGLRAVQGLAVALTLALAGSILWRATGRASLAALGLIAFGLLSWWRFVQLRPDLVSIAAALGLYRLLLEPAAPPSWRRVAAAVALLAVWANAHSAFVIGPLFLVAAEMGLALRAGVAGRWLPRVEAEAERRLAFARARRLGWALGLGSLATLANPRGWHQHATYLSMSRGVLPALDDWLPFQPLHPPAFGGAVGVLEWALLDAVLVGFAATAGLALWRLARRGSRHALAAADPVHFGLGLGCVLATLVAIRFTWTAFFPLLFSLRVLAAWTPPRHARSGTWAAALVAVALAAAFPADGRFARFAVWRPAAWAASSYAGSKYPVQAVRFLRETGVTGNLFNAYHEGGFLGYWLAPRLAPFIDGRNEAYPPDVFRDMVAIQQRRGGYPGESYLQALDRRRVDWFLGTGLPLGPDPTGVRVYTAAHLDGVPGWIPVFRTVRETVYLRALPRNRDALLRVAAWYAEQGVPFDEERGLDADAVLRERPDWAMAWGMAPLDLVALREAEAGSAPRERAGGLDVLATIHALLGDYEGQLERDRELASLAPAAAAPRRRLVYGALRLARPDEAARAADALAELDPASPRSAAFVRVAREMATRWPRARSAGARARLGALADGLPVLSPEEAWRLLAGRFRAAPPLDATGAFTPPPAATAGRAAGS